MKKKNQFEVFKTYGKRGGIQAAKNMTEKQRKRRAKKASRAAALKRSAKAAEVTT